MTGDTFSIVSLPLGFKLSLFRCLFRRLILDSKHHISFHLRSQNLILTDCLSKLQSFYYHKVFPEFDKGKVLKSCEFGLNILDSLFSLTFPHFTISLIFISNFHILYFNGISLFFFQHKVLSTNVSSKSLNYQK